MVVLLLSAASCSDGDLGKASVLVQAIKPKVLLPSSFEHVHRQLGAKPSSIANILLFFHFLDLNVSAQKAWQTPQWLVSASCQCRIARESRGEQPGMQDVSCSFPAARRLRQGGTEIVLDLMIPGEDNVPLLL